MLLVEELTANVTDPKFLTAQFENGIRKAIQTYDQAKSESQANAARMRRR